jgi:DNA-binding NtrC family response regulator
MRMEKQLDVLIVDDEDVLRKAMASWIARAGYSVETAATGRDAIAMAGSRVPAVAVIDLLLDDMPGLAVINELHRICEDTQCIVVTGQAPEDSALASTRVGAYAYVMKPCSTGQLLLLIQRAKEFGEMKRELREAKIRASEV